MLELWKEGKADKEIAVAVDVSIDTVRSWRRRSVQEMKLKAVVAALTAICAAEVIAGGILTLRYVAEGAYKAAAVQFVGYLISLLGASYEGIWLVENRRK